MIHFPLTLPRLFSTPPFVGYLPFGSRVMLNKSALTLFVTIVFAGFTAAYPKPHRRSVTPFATVSLGKRNALTRDDGTFNAEEAMRSAARTKSKHEQNLRNLQHNVLSMALLEEVRSILYNSHPHLDRYLP